MNDHTHNLQRLTMSQPNLVFETYESQVGGHGTDPKSTSHGLLTLFDDNVICKPIPDVKRGIFEVNLYRNLIISLNSHGVIYTSGNANSNVVDFKNYGWNTFNSDDEWMSNELFFDLLKYSDYYLSPPQCFDYRGSPSYQFQLRYAHFLDWLNGDASNHTHLAPFHTCLFYRALYAGSHFFPSSLGCMIKSDTNSTMHAVDPAPPSPPPPVEDSDNTAPKSQPYLLLNNLTRKYKSPAIMDIKTGQRSWNSSAKLKKIGYEIKKYPFQSAYGFRIVGVKVPQDEHQQGFDRDRKWGQSIDQPYQVAFGFMTLFTRILNYPTPLSPHRNNATIATEICTIALEQLEMLLFWLTCYPVYRMYAASVLVIMESDPVECVKKLDEYFLQRQRQEEWKASRRVVETDDGCPPIQPGDLPSYLFSVQDMIEYYSYDEQWAQELHAMYATHHINGNPQHEHQQQERNHDHDDDNDDDNANRSTTHHPPYTTSPPLTPPIAIKIIDFAHCHPVDYDSAMYHEHIHPHLQQVKEIYQTYNQYDQFTALDSVHQDHNGESSHNPQPQPQSQPGLQPHGSHSPHPNTNSPISDIPIPSSSTPLPQQPSPWLFPSPLPPLDNARGVPSGWHYTLIPPHHHSNILRPYGGVADEHVERPPLEDHAKDTSPPFSLPYVSSSHEALAAVQRFLTKFSPPLAHNTQQQHDSHTTDRDYFVSTPFPTFTTATQDHGFCNGIKSIMSYFAYVKHRLLDHIAYEQTMHTMHTSSGELARDQEMAHRLPCSFLDVYEYIQQFDPIINPDAKSVVFNPPAAF